MSSEDVPDFPKNKGYPFRQLYSPGTAPPMSVAMECSVALIILFYAVDMGNVIYKFCYIEDSINVEADSTSFKGVPEERVRINGSLPEDQDEETPAMKEDRKKQERKNNNVFDRLAPVTSMIPMLLLLFLIARLHGSVDLERTEPDEYMRQRGFVFATVCLFLEALFAALPSSLYKMFGKLIVVSRVVARVLYCVAVIIIIVKFFEMVKY